MKLGRDHMVRESACKSHLRVANTTGSHIMMFIDADDDCCKAIRDLILPWANQEVYRGTFDVIAIEREYESWLLSDVESLRGLRGIPNSAISPINHARIRGAKERIGDLMPAGIKYSETADQAELTRAIDLQKVSQQCPSFSRLIEKLRLQHSVRCTLCQVQDLNTQN